MNTLRLIASGIAVLTCLTLQAGAQQQPNMIDFNQHIQPILASQCLSCHGPKEQKGGLRVDELEELRGYITAGDAEASTLWTDYLRSQDPDMLMPPASGTHPGGLSNADLLFVKTWINEGASGQWIAASDQPAEVKKEVPTTQAGKLWAFQGLFHPAAVHLPIALLCVSSMFVFFSFFNRESCEPVAYHCLWIGALGAVAACVTGWSYAVYEGYGTGFSFDLEKSDIDRHRWLGVFVAVFSVVMVPLARNVRRTADINKRIIWMLAGLILLGAVSVTGFQGGELTYGEDHYAKYYQQLFSPEGLDSDKKLNQDEWMEGEAARVSDEMPDEMPAEPAEQIDPTTLDAPAPPKADVVPNDPPLTKPETADQPVAPSEVKQEGSTPAAAESPATPVDEPKIP